jgi:hypothetical protein
VIGSWVLTMASESAESKNRLRTRLVPPSLHPTGQGALLLTWFVAFESKIKEKLLASHFPASSNHRASVSLRCLFALGRSDTMDLFGHKAASTQQSNLE